MDKLSHLILRRLRQDAHRDTLRHALLNGLVELKLIEWNGAILRRYSPAFDTSQLTGDRETDIAWIRRHFSSVLIEPPKPFTRLGEQQGGEEGKPRVDVLAPLPDRIRLLFARKLDQAAWTTSGDERRAYAIRLVALAGSPPRTSHVMTAIVLARALADTGVRLHEFLSLIRRQSFMMVLRSEVLGASHHVVQLLQTANLLPGGRLAIGDGAGSFSDAHFDFTEAEEGRRAVHFNARHLARLTPRSIRRRLVNAAGQDLPVLVTAEDSEVVPDHAVLAAELQLTIRKLDLAILHDIAEAFHGEAAVGEGVSSFPPEFRPRWLTLDDLVLAFRRERSLPDTMRILAALAAGNRREAIEDGAADDDDDRPEGRGGEGNDDLSSPSVPAPTPSPNPRHVDPKPKNDGKTSSGKERRLATTDPARQTTGRGKRDQASGAEVIHPEKIDPAKTGKIRKTPTIEALSGYGQARDWAMNLKADLEDYDAGQLAWAELSSKLLLSGPPGTGKTTFARALCNTLQIPLVVTSVSTWLEGGHLNDVIRKMAKTFEEARELAPAILFIDELDGIGKRQPAEREYADWWNSVVNKLLELLDGAQKSEGVIVIGATNRPKEIDEAVRRSGRLETHIEIPRPDIPVLTEILAFHLGEDAARLSAAGPEQPAPAPASGTCSGEGETQHNDQKGKRP